MTKKGFLFLSQTKSQGIVNGQSHDEWTHLKVQLTILFIKKWKKWRQADIKQFSLVFFEEL